MKHSTSETASVPEQEGPGRWQRLRQWLGFVSSTSQREENGSVNNGNGNFRRIADEVPEFLDLGPQRYTDPGVWIPDVNGPLLEDKNYQRALKLLDEMEPPSETISQKGR
jgi:hypothetical protein